MYKSQYDIEEEHKQEFRNFLLLFLTVPLFAIPNFLLGSVKIFTQLLFWVLCIIILVGWIKGVPLDINNFIKW